MVSLTSSDADNSICQGESVTFTASPGGYGNYNFYDGLVSIQNGTSPTYTTNQLSNGNSIAVVATDLNCSSPASSAVATVVQPAPITDAGSNQSACIDAPIITLSGFSPAGGLWSGTGITNPSGDFDPALSLAGVHSLVYTYQDVNTGCFGYDSINFTVNDLPVINAPVSIDICENQSAQLNSSGGLQYAWNPAADLDNAAISNPIATPSSTTTYTVTATDNNNCSNTASTMVNVNPNPIADFTSNQVCEGLPTNFSNSSTPFGATFQWIFGDGNASSTNSPSHTYLSSGTYQVTLIAQLGMCYDTTSNNSLVQPSACLLYTSRCV